MFPSLKASAYILVHTPDMVMHNGTTQTTEKVVNPESEYLKAVPQNLRSYEEVVAYPPNQTYIGNLHPTELAKIEQPWSGKKVEGATAEGKRGHIYAEDEFIGWIKVVDVFDLVLLEKGFVASIKDRMDKINFADAFRGKLGEGVEKEEIEKALAERGAEPLIYKDAIVGCVNRAHDIDANLTAHVIFENLVVKASGAMALMQLLEKNNIDPLSIDYVIECSEEACGDMNQRGGGNFAKSIAEVCGLMNATGSDTRGFCAAPTHSLIEASALVKSGVYKNVVLVAGGATAKLGMNGKDHIKKGFPILEDVVGGFSILVSENDGVSPILRTDIVGRHTVGTGASPQAVITSLVAAPLEKGGLTVKDIDYFSVEMQNPDITKPAGAGDVPNANYKMIAALGVMRKELERAEIPEFVAKHGLVGWAPTQGHIPSGVPYGCYAIDDLTTGNINRAMIVGKGSLFLGRMTNQFDGVSIILERNPGKTEETNSMDKSAVMKLIAQAFRDFAQGMGD
ncbi:glycine/sarcosine/betaine reductase complex component C subunit beta [Guggenheimella bovis]